MPPARQAGKIIAGTPEDAARELVRLLRNEAKVI
jgi:electron transfer flavoprotein beta subunit